MGLGDCWKRRWVESRDFCAVLPFIFIFVFLAMFVKFKSDKKVLDTETRITILENEVRDLKLDLVKAKIRHEK